MPIDLDDFAKRYTAAWCGQDPASVAAFFAEDGSLRVNDDAPAVGRAAGGTGPGGTGKRVPIRGHEAWRMTDQGLVAESRGRFDAAEYRRQLEQGV